MVRPGASTSGRYRPRARAAAAWRQRAPSIEAPSRTNAMSHRPPSRPTINRHPERPTPRVAAPRPAAAAMPTPAARPIATSVRTPGLVRPRHGRPPSRAARTGMPAACHGSPSRWIRASAGAPSTTPRRCSSPATGIVSRSQRAARDPDDHDEPEENEADEVEATAGRLDLVGRDEVAVDADEQGRLAEGDEPEHEARDARGPGQADEPPLRARSRRISPSSSASTGPARDGAVGSPGSVSPARRVSDGRRPLRSPSDGPRSPSRRGAAAPPRSDRGSR